MTLRIASLVLLLVVTVGAVPQKKKTPPRRIVDRYITVSVSTSHENVCFDNQNKIVTLTANATDPMNDVLYYEWSVPAGKLLGGGRSVKWDLSDVVSGSYKATVKVSSKKVGSTESFIDVRVVECGGAIELLPQPCPEIIVECPSETTFDRVTKFAVKVIGAPKDAKLTYEWSVNWGKIISGQGTEAIEVQVKERWRENLTGTVRVFGAMDPSCTNKVSCTSWIQPK